MAATIHQIDDGRPDLSAPPVVQVHNEAEWNAHRDTIKQKYINENKTTSAVQIYMEEHRGFKARYVSVAIQSSQSSLA